MALKKIDKEDLVLVTEDGRRQCVKDIGK
ncbi:hypothetical protein E2C01_072735 [Portunus trituberculatus]|uniref:Uncharacterized protein n=1 Tax=Portunus trituberculatus TaxID=210409 RepID=A0A5B7I0T6_PORTR|nr:hypothetical protein [Portunus trituberculatus]